MTHSINATKDTATVTLTVTAAEVDVFKRALERALYLLDLDCDSNLQSQRLRYSSAMLYGVLVDAEMMINVERWKLDTPGTWRKYAQPYDPDAAPGAPRYPYDKGDDSNGN